jgi:hypothetical protein
VFSIQAKVIFVLFFWFSMLTVDSIAGTTDSISEKHALCLRDLTNDVQVLTRRMPSWVLYGDRRLHHMVESVRALESNARILDSHFAKKTVSTADSHLIANSLEHCRRFRLRLISYMRWWFAILIASGLTLTIASIKLVLSISGRAGIGQVEQPPPTTGDRDVEIGRSAKS